MMSIRNTYRTLPISSFHCVDWLIGKHYAKRKPAIEHAFGLFDGRDLVGVCSYGTPPRVMNNGESIFNGHTVKTVELNRLCVNEGLPRNALSFFVSQTFRQLPTPLCIVSYADASRGHHGYIYQATNWLYTGLNQIHEREWFIDGKEVHQRTLSSMGLTSAEKKLAAGLTHGEYTKKHRYFRFLGSKQEVAKMRRHFVYQAEAYPKGDNRRYDASYEPITQPLLFVE